MDEVETPAAHDTTGEGNAMAAKWFQVRIEPQSLNPQGGAKGLGPNSNVWNLLYISYHELIPWFPNQWSLYTAVVCLQIQQCHYCAVEWLH